MDDWLTGKASKGFDWLIDILNLSDDAEGILRMFQRELCQADKLYNRFHRGQQALETAADSVKAAGGTLDDVEDIAQEIADDAAKADDLPAVRGQDSA